jgi:tetratricopeptide (TPR) repeat protein
MLGIGCKTTAPTTEGIELDPLVLKRTADGRVEVVGVRDLFTRATKSFARAKYEKALAQFQEIIEAHPQSKYASHSSYNAGLCLVNLKRWADALTVFRDARQRLKGSADAWDAVFEIGHCLESLERWSELAAVSQELFRDGHKLLSVRRRIEARIRWGRAEYELNRWARAERHFKHALGDYRKNIGMPSLKETRYVSIAQYLVGEIYRSLFSSVRFRLPVETMKRDLMDKSSFFLKSHSAYLACVRFNHKRWAVAAGYRLGQLYEKFYDDMMSAEVPPELDESEREIYFEELKGHIKHLVVQSIDVYERNLSMGDRLGTADGEWTRKTKASLERMRTILRTEFNQEKP